MRRWAALLGIVMLVAACAQGGGDTPATAATSVPRPATSTTTPSTSTSPAPAPATSSTTTSSTVTTRPAPDLPLPVIRTDEVSFTSRLALDVFAPDAVGPWPVVVMLHGGGWVGGDPDDIAPLAEALAAQGAVVFNAPYGLALRGGGYPTTFEDASCAVRFARDQAASFGGDPTFVTLLGYSAGAHIGAVTALAGDRFTGDCVVTGGDPLPDAFVGIAGPYDSDLLDPLLAVFFGTDRATDPTPWEDGNPYTHLGSHSDLVIRLVQGDLDLLVPPGFAVGFEAALADAGYDVELTLVEGADHISIVDPDVDGVIALEVIAALLS